LIASVTQATAAAMMPIMMVQSHASMPSMMSDSAHCQSMMQETDEQQCDMLDQECITQCQCCASVTAFVVIGERNTLAIDSINLPFEQLTPVIFPALLTSLYRPPISA